MNINIEEFDNLLPLNLYSGDILVDQVVSLYVIDPKFIYFRLTTAIITHFKKNKAWQTLVWTGRC